MVTLSIHMTTSKGQSHIQHNMGNWLDIFISCSLFHLLHVEFIFVYCEFFYVACIFYKILLDEIGFSISVYQEIVHIIRPKSWYWYFTFNSFVSNVIKPCSPNLKHGSTPLKCRVVKLKGSKVPLSQLVKFLLNVFYHPCHH